MNTRNAFRFLNDDELDAVVGGRANDGTNYTKWQNDISPDKLPWPMPNPSQTKLPPPVLIWI
jgi:hypothetical protein